MAQCNMNETAVGHKLRVPHPFLMNNSVFYSVKGVSSDPDDMDMLFHAPLTASRDRAEAEDM